MFGWTGKILEIDLTAGRNTIIELPMSIYEKFIGGRGLCGYFFREYAALPWDHPDSPLLIFSGPLVDTPSPTSGRIHLLGKSPLTGAVGDSSVGGSFGTFMKRAGWDGIIIRGRAKGLSAAVISDSDISIVDAEPFRGATVSKIFDAFAGAGSTAAIGPAAENGTAFANIAFDSHYFAGRCGLGLVMAAKNLKYINIRGTGSTPIFSYEEISAGREDIFRLIAASPILMGEFGISEYGTGALYDLINARKMLPTKNFTETFFHAGSMMNAPAYKNKFNPKKSGCRGCHILCKKSAASTGLPIPEYETMGHFAALICNSDIDAVMEANRLCNDLGMDTISAAATISAYLEITGTSLDRDELCGLIDDIAYSRNIGADLKKGSRGLADKFGKPESSISVKGLELPAYDPRGAYGMALAYATSPRGGCHLRAYPISHEILRKPAATDRFEFAGKARIIKISEDMNAAVDSLTACRFVFFAASLEEFSRVFYGAAGLKISGEDLMRAGERIFYQERIINSMNGFSIKDDILPERFFTNNGSRGNGIEINAISRVDFDAALQKYYKIRGLSAEGYPLQEKINELGL